MWLSLSPQRSHGVDRPLRAGDLRQTHMCDNNTLYYSYATGECGDKRTHTRTRTHDTTRHNHNNCQLTGPLTAAAAPWTASRDPPGLIYHSQTRDPARRKRGVNAQHPPYPPLVIDRRISGRTNAHHTICWKLHNSIGKSVRHRIASVRTGGRVLTRHCRRAMPGNAFTANNFCAECPCIFYLEKPHDM